MKVIRLEDICAVEFSCQSCHSSGGQMTNPDDLKNIKCLKCGTVASQDTGSARNVAHEILEYLANASHSRPNVTLLLYERD